MYCSSCGLVIKNKEDLTYCSQCGLPLHKSCANHCIECGKELCDYCSIEHKYRCDECFSKTENENKITRIRRSYIEQYKSCQYSLYLQLVKGYIPPMGSNAQLGVTVHQIIDKISEHDQTLDESIIELKNEIRAFNNDIKEQDKEYSFVNENLLDVGIKCLTNFYNRKNEFKVEHFESEKNIIYKIQNDLPEISCTLDRIIWDDDDIHIHDWKTGKPMSGKKLVEDLQPGLYIEAVHKEYGKYPKTFTLHYLQNNKDITYNRIGDSTEYEVITKKNKYVLSIDKMLCNVIELLKNIVNSNYRMPDPYTISWRCNNMCWFSKAGICGGNQQEGWSYLNEKYKEEGGNN